MFYFTIIHYLGPAKFHEDWRLEILSLKKRGLRLEMLRIVPKDETFIQKTKNFLTLKTKV